MRSTATNTERQVLDFYEELAGFAAMSEAAMSEDDGYLGQCATEIAEPLRGGEIKMRPQCEGHLFRGRSRQLRLLVIEDESRVT